MIKIYTKAIALLLAMSLTFSVNAETKYSDELEETKEELEETKEQLEKMQEQLNSLTQQFAEFGKVETEPVKKSSEYPDGFFTPKFFGTIMTNFNVSTTSGDARFNVRNSRFGVKGKASRDFGYQVQIDFSNNGSVSVLDSYVQYKRGAFDVTFGQQRINLSEDMKRGPSSCLFSSRSYAAISAVSYLVDGASSISNLGSRDLGLYVKYKLLSDSALPLELGVGVFNGNGANNPNWDSNLNYTARVVWGNLKSGFSSGASIYTGQTPAGQDINVWTGEARYIGSNFMVESTYQQRRLNDSSLDVVNMANVQGYYTFQTPDSKMIKGVSPLLRWDIGDDVDYMLLDADGSSTGLSQKLDSQRLTFAVNVNFKGEKLRSRMSVGYEKFFMKDSLADLEWNPLMQDKFTVSFAASF